MYEFVQYAPIPNNKPINHAKSPGYRPYNKLGA